MPALASMLAPVRVLSRPGENATTAAGMGRPAFLAMSSVVTVRPPPAESPASAIADGSSPASSSAR